MAVSTRTGPAAVISGLSRIDRFPYSGMDRRPDPPEPLNVRLTWVHTFRHALARRGRPRHHHPVARHRSADHRAAALRLLMRFWSRSWRSGPPRYQDLVLRLLGAAWFRPGTVRFHVHPGGRVTSGPGEPSCPECVREKRLAGKCQRDDRRPRRPLGARMPRARGFVHSPSTSAQPRGVSYQRPKRSYCPVSASTVSMRA